MLRKLLFKGFLIFLWFTIFNPFFLAWAQPVDKIRFITENYPPYNYNHDGKVIGIQTDILCHILKKMNSKTTRSDIDLLPWSRGYRTIQNSRNTCLFGMARIPLREHLFKWVGPIIYGKTVIIAKRSSNIEIGNFKDLDKYRIGVVKDDIGEKLLLQKGINPKKIISSFGIDAAKEIIVELNLGIIDVWSFGELPARWILRQYGYSSKAFKIVYTLNENRAFYAFSKDVKDDLINDMQNKLDEIKKQGMYQKILDNYLSEPIYQ